jgi:hypothetical protein
MPLIDHIPAVRDLRSELDASPSAHAACTQDLVKGAYREQCLTVMLLLAGINERLARGEVTGSIEVAASTMLDRRRQLGLGTTATGHLVTGAARLCPLLRVAIDRMQILDDAPLTNVIVELDAGKSGTWIVAVPIRQLTASVQHVPISHASSC